MSGKPSPTKCGTEANARAGSAQIEFVHSGIAPGSLANFPNLLKHSQSVLAQVHRGGSIRVRLVTDAEMSSAHQKYSGVTGTTDVLTFDLSDGATVRGSPLDVDMLVCVNEARRQAQARGHSVERELLLYIVHGVLHCLGHDDHDPAAAARMHTEEDRILEAAGVGATFACEPVAARSGPEKEGGSNG